MSLYQKPKLSRVIERARASYNAEIDPPVMWPIYVPGIGAKFPHLRITASGKVWDLDEEEYYPRLDRAGHYYRFRASGLDVILSFARLMAESVPWLILPRPKDTLNQPYFLPNKYSPLYLRWKKQHEDEQFDDDDCDTPLPIVGYDTVGEDGKWETRPERTVPPGLKEGEVRAFLSVRGKALDIEEYAKYITTTIGPLFIEKEDRGIVNKTFMVPDFEELWVPFGEGNNTKREHDGWTMLRASKSGF